MAITASVRQEVRRRANFACEYCGVSEIEVGDALTIDHFHPTSKGGSDDPENLLYCCVRCNQYKLDYWPEGSGDPQLWNPRREPASQHFLTLDDGSLHPLTEVSGFTIRRLRLNRSALVAHRLKRIQEEERVNLIARYRDLSGALIQVLRQQAVLLNEQHKLLESQKRLIEEIVREHTEDSE